MSCVELLSHACNAEVLLDAGCGVAAAAASQVAPGPGMTEAPAPTELETPLLAALNRGCLDVAELLFAKDPLEVLLNLSKWVRSTDMRTRRLPSMPRCLLGSQPFTSLQNEAHVLQLRSSLKSRCGNPI